MWLPPEMLLDQEVCLHMERPLQGTWSSLPSLSLLLKAFTESKHVHTAGMRSSSSQSTALRHAFYLASLETSFRQRSKYVGSIRPPCITHLLMLAHGVLDTSGNYAVCFLIALTAVVIIPFILVQTSYSVILPLPRCPLTTLFLGHVDKIPAAIPKARPCVFE